MRIVTVTCVWHTTHELEVPDNHPHINGNDLDDLLEASGGDVQADPSAELWDWNVMDDGPGV